MKLVFMGSPEFASIILQDLHSSGSFEIAGVFSQPDKPVGRKQIMTPCAVSEYSLNSSLPLFRPFRLKDSENIEIIRSLKPDFIVVAAYGQILPKEILDIAPCINLHTSDLPRHRGAAALQSSLLNDEPYAVVSAILMGEKLDDGDLLGKIYFDHPDEAKFECLLRRLAYLAVSLLKDILFGYIYINPLKQINSDASYAKKIIKDDGLVNFDDSRKLFLKYKAYFPWPGIHLSDKLKLKEIELLDQDLIGEPGKIVQIDSESVTIECGIGRLKLLKVQPESKNEMNAGSYVRGKRVGLGDSIL